MINILRELPKKIRHKPTITTNNHDERYAIIDYIMYHVLNNDITEKDLIMVWYKSKTKNNDRSSVKNIIFKDTKMHKMKIINHTELYCDCDKFNSDNDCRHIEKLKKFFEMEKS